MEGFLKLKHPNLSVACVDAIRKEIHVNFSVENLYRKKFINKHLKMEKRLQNVNEAIAQNLNNFTHKIPLDTFFVWDFMESYSLNIINMNHLSGRIEFPTFDKRNVLLEFCGEPDQIVHTKQKPRHLVSSVVTVKMTPLSSNRVHFNYYTFDNIFIHELDFVIGNRSTLHIPPLNAQFSCPSEFLHGLSVGVLELLNENPNLITSAHDHNEFQLKLEHINGKYILKGFIIIETLSSAEIKTVISDVDDS